MNTISQQKLTARARAVNNNWAVWESALLEATKMFTERQRAFVKKFHTHYKRVAPYAIKTRINRGEVLVETLDGALEWVPVVGRWYKTGRSEQAQPHEMWVNQVDPRVAERQRALWLSGFKYDLNDIVEYEATSTRMPKGCVVASDIKTRRVFKIHKRMDGTLIEYGEFNKWEYFMIALYAL